MKGNVEGRANVEPFSPPLMVLGSSEIVGWRWILAEAYLVRKVGLRQTLQEVM